MKIVIDIPEDKYEEIKRTPEWEAPHCDLETCYIAICEGTPLPKHHGRLIDGDALRRSFQESVECCHKWAKEASDTDDDYMYARISQSLGTFVEASLRTKAQPTIIEADKGG